MIRGVNRKVIEIKKCNSDYFDRAFLLVRDDKSFSDETLLKNSAELYLGSILKSSPKNSKLKRVFKTLGLILLGFLMCLILTQFF